MIISKNSKICYPNSTGSGNFKTLVIGIGTTIWFFIGGIYDIRDIMLPPDKIITVVQSAFSRRDESNIKDIEFIFRAMYQVMSENDIKMRIENIVIENCKKGHYDTYGGGLKKGSIGTWGNTLGRYFSRREYFVAIGIHRTMLANISCILCQQ